MADGPSPGPDAGPPPTPAIGGVPLPPGYVLVERLGSGGFATVWLAEQGQLGRRVAVKLLGETLDDSERERRFLAECRAIGRLSGHPAVVTVHDAGTTEAGHPYLVMEHLPGGSLHDRIARSGPMPWAEVLDVGVSVADALAAAHAADILHRDVKPANILLDEDGAPKLGDFGIARLAEGTNTATGTLVGTIQFTPPEVLSGHRPGPTADVWALGATLHTLLAGTSPFGGDGEEPPAATIARVLRSEPAPLPASVPEPLGALVRAMLSADPGDRPQSAADVVGHLQQVQASLGLPVTPSRAAVRSEPVAPRPDVEATLVGLAPVITPPPTRVPRTPPPTPPLAAPLPAGPPPAPPGSPTAPARRRGRGPLVALVALVVVALVAGAVVVALGRGGDDDAAEGGPGPTATEGEEPPPEVRLTLGGIPAVAPEAAATMPSFVAEVPLPCGDAGCGVTASAERVVVADAEGSVRSLAAAGTADEPLEWQAQLGEMPAAPALALTGGSLIVAPSEGEQRLYQNLDPETGGLRWDDPPDLSDHVGPLDVVDGPAGSTVLVHRPDPDDGVPDGLDRGSVTALDTVSGAGVWSEQGRVIGLTADRAYLTDGARVRALDRATGDEVWGEDVPTGDRAVDNDRPHGTVAGGLVVVAAEGKAIALEAGSGDVAWSQPLPEEARPTAEAGGVAPALSEEAGEGADLVVVAGPAGDVAFDLATGDERWSLSRDGLLGTDAAPVTWLAQRGRIVVGRADGQLTVYATADGEATAGAHLDGVRGWAVLDGQVLGWTDTTVTAFDDGDLTEAWTVDGLSLTGLAPIARGFVAVGPAGPARYEG